MKRVRSNEEDDTISTKGLDTLVTLLRIPVCHDDNLGEILAFAYFVYKVQMHNPVYILEYYIIYIYIHIYISIYMHV